MSRRDLTQFDSVCLGPVGPGGGLEGHGVVRLPAASASLGAVRCGVAGARQGGARLDMAGFGSAGIGRARVRLARARLAKARLGSASARLGSPWQGSVRLGSLWQGEPAARRPSVRRGVDFFDRFFDRFQNMASCGQPGLGIGAASAGCGTAWLGGASVRQAIGNAGQGAARQARAGTWQVVGKARLGQPGQRLGKPWHRMVRRGVDSFIDLHRASHRGARQGEPGIAAAGPAIARQRWVWRGEDSFIDFNSARSAGACPGRVRRGTAWRGRDSFVDFSSARRGSPGLATAGQGTGGARARFGAVSRGLRHGEAGRRLGTAPHAEAGRGVDSLIDLHTARRGSGEARLAPAWPARVRRGVDSLIDFHSARRGELGLGMVCRGWPSRGSARWCWPWMGTAGRGDGRDSLIDFALASARRGGARARLATAWLAGALARLAGARPGVGSAWSGATSFGGVFVNLGEVKKMVRKATAKKADAAEEAPKATPRRSAKVVPIGPVGNAGAGSIDLSRPYSVALTIEGTADLLFHRWQTEAVEAVANAGKNSKQKKTDNVEAYVWRNEDGDICLPSEYLRRAIVEAAKFRQDPRSPRKSAMDLVNASIITLEPLATLGKTAWDFLDRRRVRVQRQGITRTRPAIASGWQASFTFGVLVPEYIDPVFFRELLKVAGQLIGVGDFRPSYGRFDVVRFETVNNLS